MDLKARLITLRDADISGMTTIETDCLIADMMANIGITDPELRDGLIYPMIWRMCSTEGLLNPLQLLHILEVALDDSHLFYNIGAAGDDSVFTRSYSALAADAVITADARRNFLTLDSFNTAADRIFEYLKAEKDTRGYVAGKGWAHPMAHGADMLAGVAQSTKFPLDDFSKILDAIKGCLFKEDNAYANREDERLTAVIEVACENRGLTDNIIENWLIAMFEELKEIYLSEEYSFRYHCTRVNIANFVKTMYFNFKINKRHMRLRVIIGQLLEELEQ